MQILGPSGSAILIHETVLNLSFPSIRLSIYSSASPSCCCRISFSNPLAPLIAPPPHPPILTLPPTLAMSSRFKKKYMVHHIIFCILYDRISILKGSPDLNKKKCRRTQKQKVQDEDIIAYLSPNCWATLIFSLLPVWVVYVISVLHSLAHPKKEKRKKRRLFVRMWNLSHFPTLFLMRWHDEYKTQSTAFWICRYFFGCLTWNVLF